MFQQNNTGENTSIKVSVRIRPQNLREQNTDNITEVKDNSLLITNPSDGKQKRFDYDNIYDTSSTQEYIYDTMAKELVHWTFKGYNSCLFAYGQTGCFLIDTPIKMYDGSNKRVQDIIIGDILCGDDGSMRIVNNLIRGRQYMFEIRDVDRKLPSYTVNSDHVMVVQSNQPDRIDMNYLADNTVDIKLKLLNLEAKHIGLYREDGELKTYRFEIVPIRPDEYYGFTVGQNGRFQHASGIILHNSGKTYTMMGDYDNRSYDNVGMIPRMCNDLFNFQANHDGIPVDGTITYKTEVSYMEIYSEQVYDLLNNSESKLTVREHPETGPYVENLTSVLVEDYDSILSLILHGNKHRTVASTNMNNRSSRSHAILTLQFTQIIDDTQLGKREVTSKVNLVDLAGSEKVEVSGVIGINLKEAININKSLSTLGLVIGKLATSAKEMKVKDPRFSSLLAEANIKSDKTEHRKSRSRDNSPLRKKSPKLPVRKAYSPTPVESKQPSHIPFRNSTLTWLLKESLGGNSRTYMIANISPSSLNYDESLNTLRYAHNAKQIINKVKVNEDSNDKLIRSLRNQIETLRQKIASGTGNVGTMRDELQQRELLLRDRDKTWEEKLSASKELYSKEIKEKDAIIFKQVEEQKKLLQQSEEDKRKLLQQTEEERRKLLQQTEEEKLRLLQQTEEEKQKLLQQTNSDKQQLIQQNDKQKKEFETEQIVNASLQLQKKYDEKLEEQKKLFEFKLDEQRAIYETKTEEQRIIYETKTAEQRTQYETKSIELSKEYETKLKLMISECDAKVSAIRSDYELKLATIRSDHDDKITAIRAEYDSRITNIRKEYEEKYQGEVQNLRSSSSIDYDKHIGQIEASHSQELINIKTIKEKEIESLHNKYKAEFATLNTKFKDDFEAMNNKHRDEISSLSTKHKEDIAQFTARIASLEQHNKQLLEHQALLSSQIRQLKK